MNTKMTIEECVSGVELFNEIAGNFNLVTQESLVAQANVVEEEGRELLEAALEGNPNEILKECIDCLVVVHGMAQMLQEQGYDVLGAWNAVNKNNLSKFPLTEKEACESVDALSDQGVFCTIETNDHYQVYVIKDENGKVRKPLNYKKCSVAAYTPKGIMPKLSFPEQGGLF